MNHQYDDILSLPRPVSPSHPPMPLIDRAAQFSPFTALTGYEAAVLEAARLTEARPELDESRKAYLLTRMKEKQTFVTSCDDADFIRTDGEIYRMSGGVLTRPGA